MRAKVPDSVFKKTSQATADAKPMLVMADIEKAATTEHAHIMEEVEADKARRAQKAAEAEAES